MYILDAGVGEIDFAPKQDAHFHMNAFFVESVPQGVISKIQIRQTGDDARAGKNRPNNVILPQSGVGPAQAANHVRNWLTVGRCHADWAATLPRLSARRNPLVQPAARRIFSTGLLDAANK